jgi:hypothetical protein
MWFVHHRKSTGSGSSLSTISVRTSSDTRQRRSSDSLVRSYCSAVVLLGMLIQADGSFHSYDPYRCCYRLDCQPVPGHLRIVRSPSRSCAICSHDPSHSAHADSICSFSPKCFYSPRVGLVQLHPHRTRRLESPAREETQDEPSQASRLQ